MSSAVHDMFADIAPKYDWANDVLSFGIHRLWRKKALGLAKLPKDAVVVDVCTGTGDVAFCAARQLSTQARVIGVDFVRPMLKLAQQKRLSHSTSSGGQLQFVHGDAMSLPLENNIADMSIVSFGIRNVDKPLIGLKEMLRVIKPGAKIVVIEFGQPTLFGFRHFYRLYSKWVMPVVGGLLTGNKAAYEYLPETAKAFPAGSSFLELMQSAGINNTKAIPLLFGLAYIYIGQKLD